MQEAKEDEAPHTLSDTSSPCHSFSPPLRPVTFNEPLLLAGPQLPHPRKEVGHLLSVGSSAVWRRPSVGVPNTKINKQQNHNVGGQILGRILKMH